MKKRVFLFALSTLLGFSILGFVPNKINKTIADTSFNSGSTITTIEQNFKTGEYKPTIPGAANEIYNFVSNKSDAHGGMPSYNGAYRDPLVHYDNNIFYNTGFVCYELDADPNGTGKKMFESVKLTLDYRCTYFSDSESQRMLANARIFIDVFETKIVKKVEKEGIMVEETDLTVVPSFHMYSISPVSSSAWVSNSEFDLSSMCCYRTKLYVYVFLCLDYNNFSNKTTDPAWANYPYGQQTCKDVGGLSMAVCPTKLGRVKIESTVVDTSFIQYTSFDTITSQPQNLVSTGLVPNLISSENFGCSNQRTHGGFVSRYNNAYGTLYNSSEDGEDKTKYDTATMIFRFSFGDNTISSIHIHFLQRICYLSDSNLVNSYVEVFKKSIHSDDSDYKQDYNKDPENDVDYVSVGKYKAKGVVSSWEAYDLDIDCFYSKEIYIKIVLHVDDNWHLTSGRITEKDGVRTGPGLTLNPCKILGLGFSGGLYEASNACASFIDVPPGVAIKDVIPGSYASGDLYLLNENHTWGLTPKTTRDGKDVLEGTGYLEVPIIKTNNMSLIDFAITARIVNVFDTSETGGISYFDKTDSNYIKFYISLRDRQNYTLKNEMINSTGFNPNYGLEKSFVINEINQLEDGETLWVKLEIHGAKHSSECESPGGYSYVGVNISKIAARNISDPSLNGTLLFTENYMHPEVSFRDMGTGQCLCREKGGEGWYDDAKEAFNNLTNTQKNIFIISNKYNIDKYFVRFTKWAMFNGDTIDNDGNITKLNANYSYKDINNISSNDSILIISLVSLASFALIASSAVLIFVRKKKFSNK